MTDKNPLIRQPGATVEQVSDKYRHLSVDETKSIITPNAFTVDSSLYGIALATPLRRGIAMAIDALLVGILAKQNVAFLAIVAAATFFKVGQDTKQPSKWRKTRKLFRWLSLLMLIIFIFEGIGPVYDRLFTSSETESTEQANKDERSGSEVLGSSFKYAGLLMRFEGNKSDRQCLKDKCWRQTAQETTLSMAEDGLDEETFQEIINGFISDDSLALSDAEQRQEMQRLQTIYEENVVVSSVAADKEKALQDDIASSVSQDSNDEDKTSEDKATPSTSMTQWIKGIIVDDLGFGFGWAAFYFTLFTAWWKGQTPGKRICGIRVIQLDGTRLGLWDSFGRYGGYGAGFATGLLGFFQIYWDPNRQAIQDKISATVVIMGDVPHHDDKV